MNTDKHCVITEHANARELPEGWTTGEAALYAEGLAYGLCSPVVLTRNGRLVAVFGKAV